MLTSYIALSQKRFSGRKAWMQQPTGDLPATDSPETFNGLALLPAVVSCRSFCWISAKVLLVLLVCASTKPFLLHMPSCYSMMLVGQLQSANQAEFLTDLLMTILEGCSCNARSSLPSTPSTYGSASWFMKTSSIRLVPAQPMLQITKHHTMHIETRNRHCWLAPSTCAKEHNKLYVSNEH